MGPRVLMLSIIRAGCQHNVSFLETGKRTGQADGHDHGSTCADGFGDCHQCRGWARGGGKTHGALLCCATAVQGVVCVGV